MLSTDECYTAVLLEVGPPPDPRRNCGPGIVVDYRSYNKWYEQLLNTLDKYPEAKGHDDDLASNDWIEWWEKQTKGVQR